MDQVIVVGAGPTGLITALGLAQAGIRVRVLEAEPHIINSPRAAVYHWSVLDDIEKLGLLAEAESRGFRKQDYTYQVLKTGERIPYSLEVLEGRTRHPTICIWGSISWPRSHYARCARCRTRRSISMRGSWH